MSELRDDARAQDWLTHSFEVLTMDALWTQWLNNTDRMTSDGMHEAAEYGESLRMAWLRLTSDESLDQIDRYTARHSGRMWRQATREGIWLDDGPHHPERLMVLVHGTVEALRAISEPEAAGLQRQVEELRAGVRASGDLSERATCYLLFLTPIVALALGQPLIAGAMWTWFLATKCRNVVLGLEGGG